ncbi:Transcription factor PIF1 [Sesamum alatum]|uniref:Transcription factor PIF1 n=1 Tax=Sesamum alatum TaxID=300844 RepID=A0AAE2CPZ6_9LAMI|nr:Transcription factor PIF1 [Sesamum alatum]
MSEANYNQVLSNNDEENAKSSAGEKPEKLSNDLIKFLSNVELHPNPKLLESMMILRESSGTKNKLDGEYDDKGTTGWKRMQRKRTRSAQVHVSCERRRRDRLREKMNTLKELLPTSSKSDQASLLDQAIRHIKSLQSQLQVLSMGIHPSHIAHMPEFHCIQRPSSSAPGRMQKTMDPGMGFQVPCSPLPFLMATPTTISPTIVPSVLAPILHATSTQPRTRIVPPTSFNPNHISNHEVWTLSSHDVPLRRASGSILNTGVGHGLGEHDIPSSSRGSNMFLRTPSDLSALPLSATGLAPAFGSRVQSVAPAPFPASDSVAPSTYPRLSTFSHSLQGESGFPIVPRIGPETNQTTLLQDPFATIQSLQALPSSLSSSILEMVNQTYRNTDDTGPSPPIKCLPLICDERTKAHFAWFCRLKEGPALNIGS